MLVNFYLFALHIVYICPSLHFWTSLLNLFASWGIILYFSPCGSVASLLIRSFLLVLNFHMVSYQLFRSIFFCRDWLMEVPRYMSYSNLFVFILDNNLRKKTTYHDQSYPPHIARGGDKVKKDQGLHYRTEIK